MLIKRSLLINQIILFIATLAVAMGVAGAGGILAGNVFIQPLELSWTSGVLTLVFVLIFSYALARFRVLSGWALKFLLTVLIISGSELAFSIFLTELYSMLAAFAVAVIFWLWRRVAMHNIALILAIGGMAGLMGASFPPSVAVFILLIFALYDIVAVYRTRHMIALAQNMVASGVVVGFLIPPELLAFGAPTVKALLSRSHMILGSGDSGLPALLVASTLYYGSLEQALVVALFVLFGATLMHLLFVNQDKRMPMAALPPIATAAIVGYLASLFIV